MHDRLGMTVSGCARTMGRHAQFSTSARLRAQRVSAPRKPPPEHPVGTRPVVIGRCRKSRARLRRVDQCEGGRLSREEFLRQRAE